MIKRPGRLEKGVEYKFSGSGKNGANSERLELSGFHSLKLKEGKSLRTEHSTQEDGGIINRNTESILRDAYIGTL